LGYHKSTNMWRLGGMVECPVSKAFFTYARLETIMFHCGWCPTKTLSIAIRSTLIYIFCYIVLYFGTMLT
jgi:mannitol-specific phosphotransferase system IIBC component